jgi:hypothetical protein
MWADGWQSKKPLTGYVKAVGNQTDSAVLLVPASQLGDYKPPAVPFAKSRAQTGDTILSVGCPNGTWPTLFRGHLTAVGSLYTFVPPPAGGRSGSAILHGSGGEILGVLHSRKTDNTVGYADPIDRVMADLGIETMVEALYAGLDVGGWRPSAIRTAFSSRAPPGAVLCQYITEDGNLGGCPPGGICPRPEPGPSGEPWTPGGGLFEIEIREDESGNMGLFDRLRGRRIAPTPPDSDLEQQREELQRQLDELKKRGDEAEKKAGSAQKYLAEKEDVIVTIVEQVVNLVVTFICIVFGLPVAARFAGPALQKMLGNWARGLIRSIADPADKDTDEAAIRIGQKFKEGMK